MEDGHHFEKIDKSASLTNGLTDQHEILQNDAQ